MTAPARSRTRTPPTPSRDRGDRTTTSQDRSAGTRGRSAAAERAYARRAQRAAAVGPPTGRSAKPERRPVSASRASFVILLMVLLVGGVVATLWFATQATADAYRLEQAKKDTQQLSVRVAQLRRQVAEQDSAPALGNRALQLGMVPAGDPAHLVVGADGSVTLIGTPSVAHTPPPTTTPPPTPPATTTPPPSTSTTTPTGG
jgi:hypothetical protein